jgi:5-methylcytosine-specific restriction endonuclease McrA
MGDVLVLNRSFYAIQIVNWQRALSLVYLDHARVIDQDYRTYSFEDWRELSNEIKAEPSGIINTPSFKVVIPDVIALRTFDGLPKSEVKFTRRNIYEHYEYKCAYCGIKFNTSDLNLEHVIPRSRGGKTDWTNIVTSCIPCNLKKGNRLPEEAHMKLLVQPTKPKWRGSAAIVFRPGFRIKASWQRFIDSVYWNTELDPR